MTTPSGVLVLDKPAGMTSHDAVQRVRKVLGLRKVGHAGTLDPDATGVLVICVGEATRLLEYATATDKAYEAQVVFGSATDTDDASGLVVDEADASLLSEPALRRALPEFTGTIAQQVPAYSAVHIDGKRAYQLARAGESFNLPVRSVQIHALDLVSFTPGFTATARLRVVCSKGTYIRSLCRDVGRRMGVPAHMGALRRIQSGSFGLEEAVNLDIWERSLAPAEALRPMLDVVSLEQVSVTAEMARKFGTGQRVLVSAECFPENVQAGSVMAATHSGKLVAIVVVSASEGEGWLLQPKKVFWKKDR